MIEGVFSGRSLTFQVFKLFSSISKLIGCLFVILLSLGEEFLCAFKLGVNVLISKVQLLDDSLALLDFILVKRCIFPQVLKFFLLLFELNLRL